MVAKATTIDFHEDTAKEKPSLSLPLSRVYSCELGTRVRAAVIADYVRLLLEKLGHTVMPREGRVSLAENWVAQRRN